MKKIEMIVLSIAIFMCMSGCSIFKSWQKEYDLSMKYLDEADYTEAIEAFSSAIEMDAEKAAAYEGRGNAYLGFHILSEGEANCVSYAIADYEKAVDLEQGQFNSYSNMADAYKIRGDETLSSDTSQENIQKAVSDYAEACKLDERYANIYADKAAEFEEAGDFETAVSILEEGYHASETNVREDGSEKIISFSLLTAEQQEMLNSLVSALRDYDFDSARTVFESDAYTVLSTLIDHNRTMIDIAKDDFKFRVTCFSDSNGEKDGSSLVDVIFDDSFYTGFYKPEAIFKSDQTLSEIGIGQYNFPYTTNREEEGPGDFVVKTVLSDGFMTIEEGTCLRGKSTYTMYSSNGKSSSSTREDGCSVMSSLFGYNYD